MTRTRTSSTLAIAACAFMLAIPLTAAGGSAEKTNKKIAANASRRTAWKSETLSGKITTVAPDQHLLVFETPEGVPFDMVVTDATRIKAGDQHIRLEDLQQDLNRNVSVTFTPERRGDVATSIKTNG